jgi:hypothetical protein
MTAGNQNDFLHPIYVMPQALGEGKPRINMLDYPFSKYFSEECVLTSGVYWKRQHCTTASFSA